MHVQVSSILLNLAYRKKKRSQVDSAHRGQAWGTSAFRSPDKPLFVYESPRMVIIPLASGLLQPSCSQPGAFCGTSRPNAPVCLAPGGVCQAANVTARAGGLLHRRFTLASLRWHCSSLLHCPSGCPAWQLASTAPYGERTFLRLDLPIRDHLNDLNAQPILA